MTNNGKIFYAVKCNLRNIIESETGIRLKTKVLKSVAESLISQTSENPYMMLRVLGFKIHHIRPDGEIVWEFK